MDAVGKQAARSSAPEALATWREYRRTGDRRLRDQLIFVFTPMVRYIVYRKIREIPAQCEVEDFLSCGLEALIRSIERYDPEKGATLEQFAWTRIHGAVLDELRRHDRAPRSLRRDERMINKAREGFLAAHNRQPSRVELAAMLEMEPRELTGRLDDLARAEVGSLNRTVRSDESVTVERIDTLESPPTRTPTRSSTPSVAKPSSDFARRSRCCPRRSAKWRCCCTSRIGRCARSAIASACPRVAYRRFTPSCAAASTTSSPRSLPLFTAVG